jgi:hypothetical protein
MEQLLEEEMEAAGEYAIESAVKCPQCKGSFDTLQVVRLLRTKVSFTSSLPRRGYLAVCPDCRSVIPAAIGGRLVS